MTKPVTAPLASLRKITGAPSADAQTIKFGNLVDLTGPTSDQGKDIAQGRTGRGEHEREHDRQGRELVDLTAWPTRRREDPPCHRR